MRQICTVINVHKQSTNISRYELSCQRAKILVDINSNLCTFNPGDSVAFNLSKTSDTDSHHDYIMYGTMYKIYKSKFYWSFGGMLMEMSGKDLSFDTDDNYYLQLKRAKSGFDE